MIGLMLKWKFFNRNHEKLFALDNDTLYTGSANLTKEYSGSKYGKYKFEDLMIKIKNKWIVSNLMESYFDNKKHISKFFRLAYQKSKNIFKRSRVWDRS